MKQGRIIALLGLLVLLLGVVAACGGGSSSSGSIDSEASAGDSTASNVSESSDEPVLIGIAAAKTGVYEPYDKPAVQLLDLRLDEINEEGGVLGGREVKTSWIDTKSDKASAGTNAKELISEGASLIVTTCDFDYSFPAMQAAASAGVPAISLCASSPKSANPAIVGELGGSMGPGSDSEGVAMAEWMRENRPELKSAYILKDTAIQFSQETAEYFAARWEELGGTICGEDSFVGGPTLDLSSQITRLRGSAANCDLVYDSSFIPFSAQAVRSIREAGIDLPIVGNGGVSGTAVTQVAGPISDLYVPGFGCIDTYCKGGAKSLNEINAKYKAKYGSPISDAYALPGWALANAVVGAIEKARSTEAEALGKALYSADLSFKDASEQSLSFANPACHRPQPATYSVQLFTNGEAKQLGTVTAEHIPDIGENNPCL